MPGVETAKRRNDETGTRRFADSPIRRFDAFRHRSGCNLRGSAQGKRAGDCGYDFDGYAIGGVSVGEPEEEMMRAVEWAEPFLPGHKPRYAMGLGTPPQLLEM